MLPDCSEGTTKPQPVEGIPIRLMGHKVINKGHIVRIVVKVYTDERTKNERKEIVVTSEVETKGTLLTSQLKIKGKGSLLTSMLE